MECLLPTEIARLVYGYLMEEGCAEAANMFMETSEHMKECLMYAAKGRRFNTRVLGLNLVDLLDLLADVTCFVKTVECEAQSITRDELLNKLKVTLKLDAQDPPANKPVYLRFTMPSETKHTRKDESLDSSPSANKPSFDDPSKDNRLSSPEPLNVSAERKLQVLLENKALHEKLAENINRVVANKSDAADSLEKVLEKKIVETIVNTTEQDPFFEEMLEELVGNTMMNIEKGANCKPDENELEKEENERTQRPSGSGKDHHVATETILEKALKDSGVTPSRLSPLKPAQVTPSSDVLILQRVPHFPASVPQLVPVTAASMPCISVSSVPPSLSLRESPSGPVIFHHAQPSASPLRTAPASKPDVSRCRRLLPRQPDQSSIKILSATPHQTLQGSSVVGVPPKPPFQIGEPSIYLNEKSTSPQPPPSLIRVFPSSDSAGFRVGGVRTRGGKQPLKSYGRRKQILPSKQEQELGRNQPENQNPSVLPHLVSSGPAPETPAGNVVATISVAVSSCGQTSIVTTKTPSVVQCSSGASGAASSIRDVAPSSKVDENLTVEESGSTQTTCTPTPSSEQAPAIAPSAPEVIVPSVVTPQQGSEPRAKLQKRLSLSTPRKASHVRTLEFKTPPKGAKRPQRSLTSPKSKGLVRRTEINKMIENVKKSTLFKSPDKSNEPDRPKEKKEKKAWDADLRCYAGEDEFLTSVQLKRVDPLSRRKADQLKQATPNKADSLGKGETNEDLVSRIQRDVLDVIGEEGLTDISSNSPGGKSCDSEYSPPKASKSPIRSPGATSVEIGDIGLPPSAIKRLYERTPSRDENSCTIDSPLSKAPKANLFLSPCKKISGLFNPPSTVCDSPTKSAQQSSGSLSLEATLIKECSRIESEGMERAREEGEARPGQCGVHVESTPPVGPDFGVTSSRAPLLPPKGIVVLKTPAKSEPPVPVEMTPLSKIINEETRLANLPLLTPTIPPTPDHEEAKNRSPEEVESPRDVSASQQTPVEASTKVTQPARKSPKTPSKTPVVRLKKAKTGPPKKRKKSKKKEAVEAPVPVSPSQMIAECLQNIRASVYGTSKPKSRAKPKSSRTGEKNDAPNVMSKQKPVEMKKSTQNTIKSKTSLEIIECYEKKVGRLPSTSEDEESVNELRKQTRAATRSKPPPKMTADVILEKALPSIEPKLNKGLGGQANSVVPKDGPSASIVPKLNKELGGHSASPSPKEEPSASTVLKLNKKLGGQTICPSPKDEPSVIGALKGQTLNEFAPDESRGKIDLNSYRNSFVVEGKSHCVSVSPFLCLLELPKRVVESAGARGVASSSKQESDRRRKRSHSESSGEERAKRRRIGEDRRRYAGPPYRARGRGRWLARGGSHGRGSFRMELIPRKFSSGRGSSTKNDFDRRRRSSSHSDEDNRRSHSRPSLKDHSRARTRLEAKERRSPGRNRSKNRSRESFSSARKPERSKASRPSPTERKPVTSPPHPRKSSAPGSPPQPPRESAGAHLREEGEISDGSLNTVFSFAKHPPHHVAEGVVGGRLSSPVADENRQALLQNVDLDHFLSIVHGEAK